MTVKRGRGRPPTGIKVQVRISSEMLARIEAETGGASRAEVVRRALDQYMGPNPGG